MLFALMATAQQTIAPSNGANEPAFGQKIAANATDLAIASPGYSGYVAIYRRPAGEWQRVQTLPARTGTHEYGYAMAMSDNWLAIAWRDYAANPGDLASYIDLYRRTGEEWSFVEQIDSPVQSLSGYIRRIALSDTALVVGEDLFVNKTTIVYKVHVFDRSGESWGSPHLLTAPGATNSFGYAFDVSNQMLAVADISRNTVGAVTTFRRSGETWIPVSTLAPPSTVPGAGFGRAVAICGERLAVQLLGGVPSGNTDRIAVFEGGPQLWSLRSEVLAASSQLSGFGFSIKCNASALVTGGGNRQFFYALALTGAFELQVLQPSPLPPSWGSMCLGYAVVGGDAICSTTRPTGLPQPESRGIVYAFNGAIDRVFVSGFD